MLLFEDPRLDPRVKPAMAMFGMDKRGPALPVRKDDAVGKRHEWASQVEAGFGFAFGGCLKDVASPEGVSLRTVVINGLDGNDIKLFIHTPANQTTGTCVYHTHGGGMAILSAENPLIARWRELLASRGMVVVGVEFRNASGKLTGDPAPFPKGLEDCMAGLQWVHDHLDELKVSRIITAGESGGGNLALALPLKAKAEGKNIVAGTFAMCPYISNLYHKPAEAAELCSMWENDQGATDMLSVFASLYTLDAKDQRNHLAWPYWASDDQLKGLPPTVISVNELDVLRDEGLHYGQRLRKVGVVGYSRIVAGTPHAGDVIFLSAIPEVCASTFDSIHSFCKSLDLCKTLPFTTIN